MIGKKILDKKYVSLPAVMKMLNERLGENEPSYEQEATLKYVDKFAKISSEAAEKMAKELIDLGFLDDKEVVKVIDIMPQDYDDINAIVQRRTGVLETSDAQKIIDIVKKYEKEKPKKKETKSK
ncbi:MAG: DNA-directed RNA polymerase subunit F [Candidatus Diapherotrites archaeon]|nr:DNA-directed RNA polymerase subunit F [Candidatus Diapherotrites archaeon]